MSKQYECTLDNYIAIRYPQQQQYHLNEMIKNKLSNLYFLATFNIFDCEILTVIDISLH